MIKAHHRQYLSVFLFDLSLVCITTVVPFYVMRQLEGGSAMIGVVAGLQWIMYAIVCAVSCQFVAKASNGLRVALAGGVGYTLCVPLSILVKDPYFFTVVSTIGIGCTALFWPAMQSWIGAEPDPKLRTSRMSHYNLSWTLGLTVAPPIAAYLYALGYWWAFWFAFGTGLCSQALVLTLPHESKHFARAECARCDAAEERSRGGEAHLYAAWASLLVGSILITAISSIFAKRMEELTAAGGLFPWLNGWTEPLTGEAVSYFGWMALVLYASRAGASLVMGWTHSWQGKFRVLAAFQVAAAVSLYVLSTTDSLAVMAVCCLFTGTAVGVTFFASQTYSVVNPALKHRRLAIHEAMVGLGMFVGAIVFGFLAEAYGTCWPFKYAPVLVAVGLIAQALLLRHGLRRFGRLELATDRT